MSNGNNIDTQKLLNPLNDAQLAGLKDILLQEPLLREAIEKAKAAGIDMSAQEQDLTERVNQAKKFLEVYGGK